MKKLLAVIITVFMMASGLVAFTGSSASAADCPYTGCVKTTTTASGPSQIKKGAFARIKVRTQAAGNAKPTGKYKIVVRKRGKGKIRTKSTRARSGVQTVTSGKLRSTGKYKVIIKYIPGPNDPYKRSRGVKLIRVTN